MSHEPTRREVIGNGLAFLALGSAMPTFLVQATASAATSKLLSSPAGDAQNGQKGKILVLIELAGGNDGLNTLVPHADPRYAKLRPTIGLPKVDLVPVNAKLGLHPKLKPLGTWFEQGKLGILTGVGYPNPNRSHFQAMDIWQTGDPLATKQRSGWLARHFDQDGHWRGQPLASLSLTGSLPLALYGERLAASVYDEHDTLFQGDDPDHKRQRDALAALYAEGTVASSHAEFVRRIGTDAYACTQEIKQALKTSDSRAGEMAQYPSDNSLATSLHTVARLIGGGLRTRAYYLSFGGFDTHANQPDTHSRLMDNLGTALAAFLKDLTMQGRAQDVVVMTYSEFGRRVQENGSAGTDHGAASVLFVAGGAVKGGVYGEHPGLDDLDDGDLRFHTDFRSVYATLLTRWLGSNSEPVLGGVFKPLDFV